jgi:hypothetical protein
MRKLTWKKEGNCYVCKNALAGVLRLEQEDDHEWTFSIEGAEYRLRYCSTVRQAKEAALRQYRRILLLEVDRLAGCTGQDEYSSLNY